VLAAVYRAAGLVLLPSEEEGFGFPVLESMASGTPVVASDLAVLREVGGDAAAYAAVGDVGGWADLIVEVLSEKDERGAAWQNRVQRGVCHSARFTWAEHARKMVNVYQGMLIH
jgi:glycosyltransferase involved in cell wall biosynthesis